MRDPHPRPDKPGRRDQPRHSRDIAGEVRQALDADVLVAHNAHIDVGVLQRNLGDWECPEVLDTLKLARRLLPDQASYKLGALVSAFSLADGLPAGLSPHRATYDALVTARLFVRLATHHDAARCRSRNSAARSQGGGR